MKSVVLAQGLWCVQIQWTERAPFLLADLFQRREGLRASVFTALQS